MASAEPDPVTPAEALAAFRPSKGRSGVVLAVSGGADSLALMVLWAEARARDPDLPPAIVATVDHGLRAAARDEAEFVGRIARAHGLDHRILVWEGDKPTADLQAAARAARRALLAELARTQGFDTVLLAHHADDQAETFLSRLARGSGVRGLAAMAPARLDGDILWLRPFLDRPKAELAAVLEARGIDWIRDPSNADPRFERARLRAAAADLAALGLTRDRLVATARAMARASAAIEASVDRLIATSGLCHPLGFARIAHADFTAAEAEIRLRLLARFVELLGPGEHGPRLEALERLDADLGAGEGAVVRTLGGVRIERRRGHLWFAPEAGRADVVPLAPGGAVRRGGFRFASPQGGVAVTIGPLGGAGAKVLRANGGDLGTPAPGAALLAGIVAIRVGEGAPIAAGHVDGGSGAPVAVASPWGKWPPAGAR